MIVTSNIDAGKKGIINKNPEKTEKTKEIARERERETMVGRTISLIPLRIKYN